MDLLPVACGSGQWLGSLPMLGGLHRACHRLTALGL